jgi:predicted exporter
MTELNIMHRLPAIFVAWLMSMFILLGYLLQMFWHGLPVQSDLMAMLPVGEQDPVARQAIWKIERELGDRSLLLVGADTAEQAIAAAKISADSLHSSGEFNEVILQRRIDGVLNSAISYRYALSDPAVLDELARLSLPVWLSQQAASIYGPLGATRTAILSRDPLYLAGGLLERQAGQGFDYDPATGIVLLHGEGKIWALIEARNRGAAFGQEGPMQVKQALQDAERLALEMHATTLSAGVALHTAKASEDAKSEISFIGIGSWLGSVFLIWLAFRRIRAVLLCLLPLAIGMSAALVVTVQISGSIHAVTLVFGASLIGVAIDYGTHCFANSMGAGPSWTLKNAVTQLRPALFYGVLTSVTGYLALAIAPFPGLREIAIFSSTGLIAAYFTVVAAFPLLLRDYREDTRGSRLSAWLLELRNRAPSRIWLWMALLPIGLGLWQVRADDNLHSFYRPDPALVQAERRIKAMFPATPDTQFFLVEGRDETEVLQRETLLLERLKPLIVDGKLHSVRSLSQKLPPAPIQKQRILQWQQQLRQPSYQDWMADMGLTVGDREKDRQQLLSARPVSINEWLASPLGVADQVLWLGRTERGFASLVLLSGISNTADLSIVRSDGALWVDRVNQLSDLMARYRNLALGLTAAALALMVLLMSPRYGLKGSVQIVLPSLLSAAGGVALFGLLSIPLNLFSAFALLLVLALGVDYAIFFRESGEDSRQAMLGIMLDSSTTLLSFGLLAMSSLPAARSFGLMLLFGITLAFLFAPLSQDSTSSKPQLSKD